MTNPNPKSRRRKATEVSAADYAEFIGQLELHSIWLVEAKLRNDMGPEMPEESQITFEPLEAEFEIVDEGFVAYHEYGLQIQADGMPVAEILATFGARFRSDTAMTDQIFAPFKDVNLPVNTWPFFREFVHTTLGRFGWVPFTLPAFKVGTPHDASQHGKREASRPQNRND